MTVTTVEIFFLALAGVVPILAGLIHMIRRMLKSVILEDITPHLDVQDAHLSAQDKRQEATEQRVARIEGWLDRK